MHYYRLKLAKDAMPVVQIYFVINSLQLIYVIGEAFEVQIAVGTLQLPPYLL